MIKTKSEESETIEKQYGYEEAAVKGKIYRPLDGRELLQLVEREIRTLLAGDEDALPTDFLDEIEQRFHAVQSRHPSFDTDVIAYPKADVAILLRVGRINIDNPTPAQQYARCFINVAITQHPPEENRGFGVAQEVVSKTFIWGDRQPLTFERAFNLDEIPPDALRILHDMPIMAPERSPGSGPSGEATVVDVKKPAPPEQKKAVERQFTRAEVEKKKEEKR